MDVQLCSKSQQFYYRIQEQIWRIFLHVLILNRKYSVPNAFVCLEIKVIIRILSLYPLLNDFWTTLDLFPRWFHLALSWWHRWTSSDSEETIMRLLPAEQSFLGSTTLMVLSRTTILCVVLVLSLTTVNMAWNWIPQPHLGSSLAVPQAVLSLLHSYFCFS